VRFALLAVGVGTLGFLIADNDPAAILASFQHLGWRLGILIVFPMVLVAFFDAVGWRYAFTRDRVSVWTLLWTRLAGEAFNLTTPTAALGGEAVKAWLLRDRVPLPEAVSSVIVAKTTITIGQGLLLLLGVVLAWTSRAADSRILMAMEWLLALELVALSIFVLAQTRGMASFGGRLLARFGAQRFERHEGLGHVDRALAGFYLRQPGRLALSIAYHFLAWLLGALEAWLILWLLGTPVSLLTATVIEAFGMGIRFATFLIPSSLGALEGGYAATFAALGLGATRGVTFSLVRRVREIVWIAIGLIAFAVLKIPRPPDPTR
jgi:glycosyltransferase 2 family protein